MEGPLERVNNDVATPIVCGGREILRFTFTCEFHIYVFVYWIVVVVVLVFTKRVDPMGLGEKKEEN